MGQCKSSLDVNSSPKKLADATETVDEDQPIRVLSFNKTSSSSSVSTMGLDNVHHRTSDSSTDVMSADDDDDTVELWSEQQRLQLEENIEALGLGERINL